MARCDICGRKDRTGNSVSHAHNTTKRKFRLNLQTRRDKKGKKQLVCTRCIKSQNKVAK